MNTLTTRLRFYGQAFLSLLGILSCQFTAIGAWFNRDPIHGVKCMAAVMLAIALVSIWIGAVASVMMFNPALALVFLAGPVLVITMGTKK